MAGAFQTWQAESSWRHEAPYGSQKPEAFGPVYWNGSCNCGRVTYQFIREKPLDVKFCHCRGCQVLHGAPFQWAAIFHKEDMNFTNGSEDLDFYNSSHKLKEHKLPCKASCLYCHSLIMDEGRNVILLFPESIDFTQGLQSADQHANEAEMDRRRKLFAPSCHIFYSQRVVDIDDGKPKWAGMNDSSRRLD